MTEIFEVVIVLSYLRMGCCCIVDMSVYMGSTLMTKRRQKSYSDCIGDL